MWANLGYELPIKEGVYWLDNNFIKAFTPDGTLHKLWKYKVFDDLHIEITKHKDNKMMLSNPIFPTPFTMINGCIKFHIKHISCHFAITFRTPHCKYRFDIF